MPIRYRNFRTAFAAAMRIGKGANASQANVRMTPLARGTRFSINICLRWEKEMKRGLFQEIIPEEFINSSTRNWNISLLKSLDIWGEFAYSDYCTSHIQNLLIEYLSNCNHKNKIFLPYLR